MSLDPYSPCPGGTGKKIKFCCSDLVHELDKLDRMIDGDQRVAALDYVRKIDAKFPGRACLLSYRATLEASLGNLEQSEATLATFREKHPENPIALAELAVLEARSDKPAEALRSLEKGMALCGDEIPPALYDAYGSVAEAMADARHIPAAQALYWFQASLSRGEDQEALKDWAVLQADPQIPLLLRVSPSLEPAPPGAPWKYEFEVALDRAAHGQWHTAAEKFAALIPIAGNSPALWLNLARLRAWTTDYAGVVEALRKCAALEISPDDAVEAEATALVFDIHQRTLHEDEQPPRPSDLIKATFTVNDQASLEERFAADRRLDRLPIDAAQWREAAGESADDQPPPRACYTLLDRPLPNSPDAPREQIPFTLGTLFLYGRQTDRPERIELLVTRSSVAAARDLLGRISGDALGGATEEVLQHGFMDDMTMDWRFRFPDGIPVHRQIELDRAEARHRILEAWPDSPLPDLDGKTPRQAATDPHLRRRVMAHILLMQGSRALDDNGQPFGELRERLGLPQPAPIDPKTVKLADLPLVRLSRLQVDRLSDDELLQCYRRAKFSSQSRAVQMFAKEIASRASLAGRAEVVEAYSALFAAATDSNAALQIVEQGRAAVQRAKQSTAPWDLAELRVRVERREGDEFGRVLKHIEREHIREPGVADALFRFLYEIGMIDEHGRYVTHAKPEGSPIIVPGAAAPGKILVPGAETSAAGESSKPVIWTP